MNDEALGPIDHVGFNEPREMVPPGSAKQVTIVGIGASAGGLEALSALLKQASIDGAAFIVVQHLAPTQNSILTELLGRASPLKVVTASEGAVITANHVYVTPPNAEVAVVNGTLHLTSTEGQPRPHLPIDAFFHTLATDAGTRAIGVVLSGMGADGTAGLAAIKAAGGITFVQDPATAKFDGMPRSALASGEADFCLAPAAIADEIVRISSHPYVTGTHGLAEFSAFFPKLTGLFKRAFGIDLSQYKLSTVERRLERRLAVHKLNGLDDYLKLCAGDRTELATLRDDLLINVTEFFRDGAPFKALGSAIIPAIIERKKDAAPIRVWVAGCSSGEEAYSIGMLLLEAMEGRGLDLRIQIFGTDLDEGAIAEARRGVYPESRLAHVSHERLRRFFVKMDDGHHQVVRRLREMVVFSAHNITRDPPFSRLDLVTCRNLLIYLEPATQQRILRLFHFALKPDGFLMLGSSEGIGEAVGLFAMVDRKNKFYSAKHVAPSHVALDSAFAPAPTRGGRAPTPVPARPPVTLSHLADRAILEKHAPPGLLIDENLDIMHFRGLIETYLQRPSGAATHNALRLIRPELHAALKKIVKQVLEDGVSATVAAELNNGELGFTPILLAAQLIQEPQSKARCVLVLFKEAPKEAPSHAKDTAAASSSPDADARVVDLRQELTLTKDFLQSTIEEMERGAQDMNAINEELQSSNEELQSTNEELETSKEEIQSTNEELITLNDELQNRMRDLGTANDDLQNLLLGVDRAIVIVGVDLRIRRITQAAEKLLNLVPEDVGRSASQLNSFLGGFGVEKVIGDAIANAAPLEKEIQATDRRWYSFRVAPYKTTEMSIRGAVISIVDIDLSRRRRDLTTAVDRYAVTVLSAIQNPLVILNHERTIIWVNAAYYAAFGVSPVETVGTRLENVGTGQWNGPDLRRLIDDALISGAPFRDHDVAFESPGGGKTTLNVGGSRLRDVGDDASLVLLSIEGDLRPLDPERTA